MELGAAAARGEPRAQAPSEQQAIPQQAASVCQHIPGVLPALAPALPTRPGHVREDLIELMTLQNAQMHQVLMSTMTLSALTSCGFSPAPPPAQVSLVPLHIEDDDDDEDQVFHHHYVPYAGVTPGPAWQPLAQPPAWAQEPPSIRHLGLDPFPPTAARPLDEERVPPPPPPSATGTVGADVPPAEDYYDYTQGKQ